MGPVVVFFDTLSNTVHVEDDARVTLPRQRSVHHGGGKPLEKAGRWGGKASKQEYKSTNESSGQRSKKRSSGKLYVRVSGRKMHRFAIQP